MNVQNLVSLKISRLRDKAIDLTKEFDSKNRLGRENYSKRLDNFLKRRIGKESKIIFVAQMLISNSILETQYQKV